MFMTGISILNKTIMIRTFCFWVNSIMARNFNNFPLFSYIEFMVLQKKVTILAILSSLYTQKKKQGSLTKTQIKQISWNAELAKLFF